MDNDQDFPSVQGKKRISRLSRKKPTKEKNYLRMVKKMEKNAADKGLTSRKQTIELVKLMLRVEDSPSKFKLLKILANSNHVDYLKLFIDNHGLQILYLWMVRCKEADFYLKIAILKTLAALPVSSKTTLKIAKVWDLVEKWSNTTKENGKDDVQVVDFGNSDKKSDKDYRLSNKVRVSDRSSEENTDLTETVELEENHDQQKASQKKDVNQNEISDSSEKKIKSITLDSDCDELTESQVQPKSYDRTGKISEDFIQDIIMQMSIILKERKLSTNSVQSEISLESSQNNTTHCDKESFIEPSKISISSSCHKPFDSLGIKTADSLSKSKDQVQNCAIIKSSSKPKNWTAADVVILAKKLLEQWKDLKEAFKIPKIAANEPVETEKNNKETEKNSDSSKAGKISVSSNTDATKDSSRIPNNVDKNKDKNQGNKETNQHKKANKLQDVSKKSNINRKKHRGGRRNLRFGSFNRFERCERSYPQPEFGYQFGPQDYLGLYQQANLNYEYYPSYFYLNQLPWQTTHMNNYH